MSFRLVLKSVTLNDIERRSGRYFHYFSEIDSIRGALRKSGWRCSQTFCDRNVVQSFYSFSVISLMLKWWREPLHRGRGWNARGVAKYSDFGRIEGYISETCKIWSKLVLITNRKTYTSFRLVPKSVTSNDLERRNGPYFALFHRISCTMSSQNNY